MQYKLLLQWRMRRGEDALVEHSKSIDFQRDAHDSAPSGIVKSTFLCSCFSCICADACVCVSACDPCRGIELYKLLVENLVIQWTLVQVTYIGLYCPLRALSIETDYNTIYHNMTARTGLALESQIGDREIEARSLSPSALLPVSEFLHHLPAS
jgi:hypothetical protein